MTSVDVARAAPDKVRAALPLDPWFFPRHKECMNGEYTMEVPCCMILTETFYKWCKYPYAREA
jgi:hypothetical protein